MYQKKSEMGHNFISIWRNMVKCGHSNLCYAACIQKCWLWFDDFELYIFFQ